MALPHATCEPGDDPCCARGACKASLKYGNYYKIWNNPPYGPRLYCEPCGHKIMYYNKADALNGGLVLQFEIVNRSPEGLLDHVDNSEPFGNQNSTRTY